MVLGVHRVQNGKSGGNEKNAQDDLENVDVNPERNMVDLGRLSGPLSGRDQLKSSFGMFSDLPCVLDGFSDFCYCKVHSLILIHALDHVSVISVINIFHGTSLSGLLGQADCAKQSMPQPSFNMDHTAVDFKQFYSLIVFKKVVRL